MPLAVVGSVCFAKACVYILIYAYTYIYIFFIHEPEIRESASFDRQVLAAAYQVHAQMLLKSAINQISICMYVCMHIWSSIRHYICHNSYVHILIANYSRIHTLIECFVCGRFFGVFWRHLARDDNY